MINVEALFYGAHNNDKTRNYAYELMEAQSDWSGIDTPYLSNHIIENYLDLQSTFNVLRTIFICLFVVFLCIGTFILYKHITDSIDFVEKDFGVLKAIGVKALDIFRIINILSLIISICVIALSFILQYCGILLVNEITSNLLDEKFTSYYIDYRNYIVIFAVSAIVPLLITIYPVIKSSRRNPKDILNNN
jgi:ABC-type lipoprotein release transport system permease subunit